MTIGVEGLKPGMKVRDNQGELIGTVQSTQGAYVKLEPDSAGEHRWIALAMIDRIEKEVYLNVDKAEVERVWTTNDPYDPEDVIDA